MLLKKDLINSMDSLYSDMLKEVNIPDFTKCIAQFAGMRVQDVKDDIIREYLVIWAEHKLPLFNLLGKRLKLDMPISYKNYKTDICSEFELLKSEFPGFAPWIGEFSGIKHNKVESYAQVGYYGKNWLRDLFPDYQITGNTLTGFFKRKLNAPDELITAIGRIFENETIEGTYTISIDPVDMMLASENPYKWQSCYRLEVPNDASHADGCLAAILDRSSLITYIWDKEGKFNLYDHELKSIRYKRIREWISIAPDFNAIHFNQIYPGKQAYPDEFRKQLRDKVETLVANYMEFPNVWVKTTDTYCSRVHYYGYGEFDCDNIWKVKGSKDQTWEVYDTDILCPCGCGDYLPKSDEGDDYVYTGEGFIAENYRYNEWEEPYCSLADGTCCYADDICDGNCRGCRYYDDEYPLCNLDDTTECENPEPDLIDNGRMQSCNGHCQGCPLWAQHHPEEAGQEEEMETETVTVNTGDVRIGQNVFSINSQGSMGMWLYDPPQDVTTYTPYTPCTVTRTAATAFNETVTLDQIRDAVEQAPPLNIMDITTDMIQQVRDEAIANGTARNEIVFGISNEGGLAYRDVNYENLTYNIEE